MNSDVFICHSSKDAEIANAICEYLEKEATVRCWIAPRNITGGKLYAEEIVDAIEGTQVFVLLYSKDANISNHVFSELNCAFNAEKPIIPFCIDDSKMRSRMVYYTNTSQAIMAYPDPWQKFDSLKDAVMRNIPELQSALERKQAYALLAEEIGISEEEMAATIKVLLGKGKNGENKQSFTYDYAICYNEIDVDIIGPVIQSLVDSGVTIANIPVNLKTASHPVATICEFVDHSAAFICFDNGESDSIVKCSFTAAAALEKPIYLCSIGEKKNDKFYNITKEDARFSLSDEKGFIAKILELSGVVSGRDSNDFSPEVESDSGIQSYHYDMLQNAAGEILIMIEYREDPPENPRLVYDGQLIGS